MAMIKHKAIRDEDGDYEYRGRSISRHDETPAGYVGRWRMGTRVFTTLREAKEYIDKRIEKRIEKRIDEENNP